MGFFRYFDRIYVPPAKTRELPVEWLFNWICGDFAGPTGNYHYLLNITAGFFAGASGDSSCGGFIFQVLDFLCRDTLCFASPKIYRDSLMLHDQS